MSFSSRLLKFVRDNPGVTGPEVHKYFYPKHSHKSISGSLSFLATQGMIENRGNHGRYSCWYPIKFEEPKPEYIDKAKEILSYLKTVPKSEREKILALYLQRGKLSKDASINLGKDLHVST